MSDRRDRQLADREDPQNRMEAELPDTNVRIKSQGHLAQSSTHRDRIQKGKKIYQEFQNGGMQGYQKALKQFKTLNDERRSYIIYTLVVLGKDMKRKGDKEFEDVQALVGMLQKTAAEAQRKINATELLNTWIGKLSWFWPVRTEPIQRCQTGASIGSRQDQSVVDWECNVVEKTVAKKTEQDQENEALLKK